MNSWIRRAAALAAVAVTSLLSACVDSSHQPTSVESRDGMSAYLGVVPVAVVLAHAPEHPERSMHASPSANDAHLVVAIYDDATGARIEDATIKATIRGERHGAGRHLRLEAMRIEDSVTYGGFVSLPVNDRYHVDLSIQRGAHGRETQMRFLFDAAALARADAPLP